MFGGTSNGVFGQTTSPLASTPTFGISSAPTFGSSMPAFGSSSTSAFGSSSFGAFGQSSSSPFGSPSVFGQTSSSGNNPFASKPFGSSNPFGSQTGSSIFGGTSTGVFGQASTPTFGASSTPASGSSISTFGAPSTPSFGSSTASFGGSSAFGQKPAFGAFGSTPSQASPFGSTFQQTQSSFGNNLFGSTTSFGAPSQSAFGTTTTPAFGSTSASVFGSATAPTFGATTPNVAFGTTPFGSTGMGFGVSSNPPFGSSVTSAFGAPSSSFGPSSSSAFGSSSTSPSLSFNSTPFVGSSAPTAFGSSTTSPSFNFSTTPSFVQSTSPFGSTPFGTTSSPFSSQSSSFGAQTTTQTFGGPTFGQSTFGGQQVGSRVAAYSPTPEADGGSGTQAAGKLESISAMPVYKDKSHEELRLEDYQRGDKGGPNPSVQTAGVVSFPAQTQGSPFSSTVAFNQSTNPFSSTSPNLFGPKTPAFSSTSAFGSSTSNFSAPSTGLLGSSSGTFGISSTGGFGLNSSSPNFGMTGSASSSPFGSSLNIGNTQSSGLFQSSSSSIGQPTSLFGQPSTGFQQNNTGFGSNLFNTPSSGLGGGLFSSSTPSIFSASNPVAFGQTTPTFQMPTQPQTPISFPSNNFGQSQQASSGGFLGSVPNIFNQGSIGAVTQPNMVVQPTPISNPFGTLPTMPQMSIGRVGSAPSVQYGISSMPVAEKPTPVRVSSLLTPRHLSQRRIRLPARKYNPKSDSSRVPFFADDEATSTPKADALFIPRENPRVLIIHPPEQWPSRTTGEKQYMLKDAHLAIENGKVSEVPSAPAFKESFAEDRDEGPAENGHGREQNNSPRSPSEHMKEPNGVHDDHAQRGMDSSYITISGYRAGEAAIVYEHGADIEALMPKLRHTDYYTEPRIQELAAKERAEPGFCRRVRDFVVGRQGFGSIKFYGDTDVRRLDLESIVQFSDREVIVYQDESKKPPVGQGLNKPGEVTLLNIRCMNKKTGQQYTEGPRVERYMEMLMKKAQEQGAEFVSFDVAKGEWKFRVEHFSRYELGETGESWL